jgi:hypothetical protein
MNLYCHFAYVDALYDDFLNVEKKYNIILNKKLLRLGSITPDIHPILRLQSHDQEKIISFYERFQNNIYIKGMIGHQISYYIGVLSHYICDTYCIEHHKMVADLNSFVRHVKYEKKMVEFVNDFFKERHKDVSYNEVSQYTFSPENLRADVGKYIFNNSSFNTNINDQLNLDVKLAYENNREIIFAFINDAIEQISENVVEYA